MMRPIGIWPFWEGRDNLPEEFLPENRDLHRPRRREELLGLENWQDFW